jgi:hypothetical protein
MNCSNAGPDWSLAVPAERRFSNLTLRRKFRFNFSDSQNSHCEPTGRANARPMTGSAQQSIARDERMDCFVAALLAMTSL